MWKNYLTVAYRALTKNRTYAVVNIAGLALGLAACLTILLYVGYETSYDSWIPDSEQVYQVQTFGRDPATGERLDQQGVTRPVGEAMAKDFPQIEAISKVEGDSDSVVLKDGQALKADRMVAVDQPFFDIIRPAFLRGSPATALRDPHSIALSRSEAERQFGTLDVLGRTLTILRDGHRYDLRVTAVFDDFPKNSHMDIRSVRRFNTAEEFDCGWGCVTGGLYLKLKPGTSPDQINGQMQAWERRNVPVRDIAGGEIRKTSDWGLVNIRDVHLGTARGGDRPGNDRGTLATFTIIALLILGIGCANFVNLATARASQRAREVAVRKVLGARRGQLILQFLGESVLLVILAMIIALALLELTLPAFNAFLDTGIRLHYLGSGGLLLPVVAITLVVGLAGGLYPAFYLSRFKPSAVLKANRSTSETPGSGRLRTLLVVAQFAVSIGLIICTAIVYQQTLFARTTDVGYQRDGLLEVRGMTQPDAVRAREALTREIARIDGVTGVSGTMIVPGTQRTLFTTPRLPGSADRPKIGWYSVEPDFFRTMKIRMLAGRALSKDQASDNIYVPELPPAETDRAERALAARGFNVVLNETAVRRLGLGSAGAALGRQIEIPAFGEEKGMVPATIVGVAQDTRYRSLREPVEPIIYYDAGVYVWLAVRYHSAQPEAVRARVEAVWRKLLPQLPFDAEFAEDKLQDLYRTDVARGQTFGGFAFLAVVVACLGLFGLAAFTADRRTREIGIRKVFGASVQDIVKLLVWQFSKPVVVANLIAWPVAWWVMRDWLNSFDARIALTPGPFLLAGMIAFAIAVFTVAGHAIRVARANPIHALRYE